MDYQILISNLLNPTLLFFVLGILATLVSSDLKIPQSVSKFISLYLLLAIGFKGGQELAVSTFSLQILYSIILGLLMASLVPLYTFFILKRKLNIYDAGAIAATYGSVSAVTFVSAVNFLEAQHISFGGHMVAIMALMESPAIIVGVILMKVYDKDNSSKTSITHVIKHSLTNGSVLLILGSLVIGFISDHKLAEGIKPFTNDIFKGFLAIFLLEMGMLTAKRIGIFKKYGWFVSLFAVIIPMLNGCIIAMVSGFITDQVGDRFLLSILAASASYIAVPAAMKLANPKSDPGLYIPMALGLTFPFNISLGMPLYFSIIQFV
jgi:hypothetical protein